MNYLLNVIIAFVFGFLLGWNLSAFFIFLAYMAFGYALVLVIDVACGLGPKVSAARYSVREQIELVRRACHQWWFRRWLRKNPQFNAIFRVQR